MNSDGIRWQQRLENFEAATARLVAACAQGEYSDLEQAGLVQTFEFSFELASKTLKDLLFFEGYDEKTPRDVLRRAFEAGYLDGPGSESALDALDKRNLLSHTYHEKTAQEAVKLIKESYAPTLHTLLQRLKQRQGDA